MTRWALWLTLAGCTGVAEQGVDYDLDGFAEGEDCNDKNGQIFPGGEELCDLLDNDCDGDVDEDVTTITYADADDDGFGDPLTGAPTCGIPDGRIYNNSDCDDSDPELSPLADEICDGVDNNCDDQIDIDLAYGGVNLYADNDDDGYGTAADQINTCVLPGEDPPEGWVYTDLDCDDSDQDVHPFADEVCDGIDNDCEDGADVDADNEVKWYLDDDGDGFGSDQYVEACTAPNAFYVSNSDDCNDLDNEIYPNATEVCDDVDNDCDAVIDTDATVLTKWYADQDVDGYGTGAEFVSSCDAPPGWVANGTDCDDDDGSIHPNATEVCLNGTGIEYDGVDQDCDGTSDPNESTCPIIHCGSIEADETWANTRDHLVACEMTIGHPLGILAPTLTIEDDANLEFVYGASLFVGTETLPGHLVAGSAYFWSASQWDGVGIQNVDSSITLTGSELDSASFGVVAGGGTLELTDVTIANSAWAAVLLTNYTESTLTGLDIDGAGLVGIWAVDVPNTDLSDSTIHNADLGVLCDSPNSCFSYFENNDLNGNDVPMHYPAAHLSDIGIGNDFSGNAKNYVEVGTYGPIDDPHWPALNVPYSIGSELEWNGLFQLDNGAEILVGDGGSIKTSAGDLAIGGTSPGVSIASDNGTGTYSISIDNAGPTTNLAGLAIDRGQLSLSGSQLTLSNFSVSNSAGDALYVESDTVDMHDITIEASTGGGAFLLANQAQLSNIDVSNTLGQGISVWATNAVIGGLNVQEAGLDGILLNVGALQVTSPLSSQNTGGVPLALLGPASTLFNLNGGHSLFSSDPTNSVVWIADSNLSSTGIVENPGIPIRFPYGLNITQGAQVQFDQAQVQFGYNTGLNVGVPGNGATLIANGATFTSQFTPPTAGDWTGIKFDSSSSGSLNGAVISYAGGLGSNPQYGLYLGGITSLVPLQGVSIRNLPTAAYGIYCYNGCPINYPSGAQATFVSVANPHN